MLTPSHQISAEIQFLDWGLIDYETALVRQMDLVEKRIQNDIRDSVIFCSHPSIVTLGRATEPEKDLAGWSGPIVEIQRGGRATYHGPGQAIGYPILDLKNRGSDLHKYLRYLENVMICSLRHFGIEAEGDRDDATGVWIGSKKIASIGIGVKRWVSFHGYAVNLHRDPVAFTGINPCGFRSTDMISLEELIGQKVSHSDFNAVIRSHFF